MKYVMILLLILLSGCTTIETEKVVKEVVIIQNETKCAEVKCECDIGDLNFFRNEYFLAQKQIKALEVSTSFQEYDDMVFAWGIYNEINEELYLNHQMCIKFNGRNVEETIDKIKIFVDEEFHYDTTKSERIPNLAVSLKTREGDCTEKAMILNEIFRCNGIYSRIVHGYDGGKHDWVEYLMPHDGQVYWRSVEDGNVLKGEGIW